MIPFSVEFEEELWGLREDEEAQKAMLDAAEGAKSAMPKMVVQVRDSRGPSDAKRDTRNETPLAWRRRKRKAPFARLPEASDPFSTARLVAPRAGI
jgi:hypothetical protein